MQLTWWYIGTCNSLIDAVQVVVQTTVCTTHYADTSSKKHSAEIQLITVCHRRTVMCQRRLTTSHNCFIINLLLLCIVNLGITILTKFTCSFVFSCVYLLNQLLPAKMTFMLARAGMCVCVSVVVLKESPCPRGPIYKSLSLDHKVLENF